MLSQILPFQLKLEKSVSKFAKAMNISRNSVYRNLEKVACMREKFELLIQINTSIEKGEIPNLDDIFHADYLYLKDNTLVNRDEHVEFMRKEFTRKITVINPQFLYEDKDIMTYSYNIKVRENSYRVIQVQMWKDGKIWREMSNAVEI